MVSQDGGKSWEETHDRALPALWPGATGKFRCVLGDGTWLDMGAGGRGGDFDAPEVLPIGQRAEWEAKRYCTRDCENDPGLFYLSGKDLHIGKSRAGGATWQRQAIPAPEEMVNLNGFRGLRLRDGTLLFPVGGAVDHPGLDLRAVEGAVWRQYVARSTDDGATWEWAQMIEDPRGVYTEEVALLEVADNLSVPLSPPHATKDRHSIPNLAKSAAHERKSRARNPHDLRHTFASHAAMNKETLPMIGRLLGHANAGSTVRYAHFDDDHVLEAAEQIGAAIERMLCD